MRHPYVGDVGDFGKYGLLGVVGGRDMPAAAVCA